MLPICFSIVEMFANRKATEKTATPTTCANFYKNVINVQYAVSFFTTLFLKRVAQADKGPTDYACIFII